MVLYFVSHSHQQDQARQRVDTHARSLICSFDMPELPLLIKNPEGHQVTIKTTFSQTIVPLTQRPSFERKPFSDGSTPCANIWTPILRPSSSPCMVMRHEIPSFFILLL
ncbi:unnamed protein product [Cyclocybe aegerita]|uniref:Uncharacterized protein n=1 Tax=Cyclocybe aegerita TaxID=1973307 RepID=A0A8S0WB16_CYCAE|nr:unnamed protein product [Cyclocybe aegerita]